MSENQNPKIQADNGTERSVLELPSDKKIDVALTQLSERYTALHNMRDRSMQFTIWILGLGLALAWLLLSEIALTTPQTIVLLIMLIAIPYASYLFLRGIKTGFKNNLDVARRLERALHLLEPGAYLEKQPILDEDFAGEKPAPPKHLHGRIKHAMECTEHFHTLNCLLITVFLLLFLLTLANPCGRCDSKGSKQQNVEKIEGGNAHGLD